MAQVLYLDYKQWVLPATAALGGSMQEADWALCLAGKLARTSYVVFCLV